MLLSQLVWQQIQPFCEKNFLSKSLDRTTNTCSIIALTRPTLTLQIFVDEMELRIESIMVFSDNGEEQCRRLLINSDERISYFRHRALRAWRRSARNKALFEMIQAYLSIIQKVFDNNPCK